jgi:hypothetical protein
MLAKQKQKSLQLLAREQKERGETPDLVEKGKAQALSIISSLIVVIVNAALLKVIRALSLMERAETTTKLNVSVAFKLTIARFINSSAVLVAVNNRSELWFEGGSLI